METAKFNIMEIHVALTFKPFEVCNINVLLKRSHTLHTDFEWNLPDCLFGDCPIFFGDETLLKTGGTYPPS